MNQTVRPIAVVAILLFGFMVFLTSVGSSVGTSEESTKPAKDKNEKISAIEFPIPQSDQDRTYLGLEGPAGLN